MPSYSKTSRTMLAGCHRDLQVVFNFVIQSFDHSITCGHRGETEQNKAYNEGKSQLAWPHSLHNRYPSMAVDAVPYPIQWSNTPRMRLFAGYVLGVSQALFAGGFITHLILWGGDWDRDNEMKDNRFNDLCHFQLYRPH
jgi:peptidoglycan L-alanyl-D-glutamate endopeptidase CwlK